MKSSLDLKSNNSGENVLESCNNKYWRAPLGKTGNEAEIVIDLNCTRLLETFSVMNGFGNFGTKKFSMFGSREVDGPWDEIYRGELPPGEEMTEEVRWTAK